MLHAKLILQLVINIVDPHC